MFSQKFRKFYRKKSVLEPLSKNTYLEEQLWTTASKKINICWTFK